MTLDSDKLAIADTPLPAEHARPRVLVVDDDLQMRVALKRALRAAGFEAELYASADELLAEADLASPGVLLLDVMMPGMNGLALQAELRSRGVALPLIFLTGSGDVPMAVEAMRNGAADFLEKPFDNEMLLRRLSLAFDGDARARAILRDGIEFRRRRLALTPREREVMERMVEGKSSKAIARELGASHRTIEIHRGRVMQKMEAASLAELVRRSLEAKQAD